MKGRPSKSKVTGIVEVRGFLENRTTRKKKISGETIYFLCFRGNGKYARAYEYFVHNYIGAGEVCRVEGNEIVD